jgi:hypothetical protein
VNKTGCVAFSAGPGLAGSGFSSTVTTLFNGGALVPGSTYFVRSRSVSSLGASLSATISTPPSITLGSLPNDASHVVVRSHRSMPTRLNLTWEAPAFSGGFPVINYTVQWWAPSSAEPCPGAATSSCALCGTGSALDCPRVANTSTMLSGLVAGVNYTIRVLASTKRGESLGVSGYAQPTCDRDLEACTPLVVPRRLPAEPGPLRMGGVGSSEPFSASSILLTWFGGAETDNIPTDFYRVEWDTSAAPFTLASELKSAIVLAPVPATSEVSFSLVNLTKGIPVTARVRAHNSLGFGVAGAPKVSTPAATVGAPLTVSISPLASVGELWQGAPITSLARGTSLSVTFTPPVDNGGSDVTEFVIAWAKEPLVAAGSAAALAGAQAGVWVAPSVTIVPDL